MLPAIVWRFTATDDPSVNKSGKAEVKVRVAVVELVRLTTKVPKGPNPEIDGLPSVMFRVIMSANAPALTPNISPNPRIAPNSFCLMMYPFPKSRLDSN